MRFQQLRRIAQLAIAVAGGVFGPSAFAETIRVPEDSRDLKAALARAHDGDTILVADGVYSGRKNRALDFRGKSLTLRSSGGAGRCILDCEGADRAFHFRDGETSEAVLEGFTIQNGTAIRGGAILVQSGSSPTIRDCVFVGNVAFGTEFADGGGAIRCEASSPTIVGCSFDSNVATGTDQQGGGAINLDDGSSALLIDCSFFGNRGAFGGALSCTFSSPSFMRCSFDSNAADLRDDSSGGAIILEQSDPTFVRCSFTRNYAAIAEGAVLVNQGSPLFLDCTFLANRVGPSRLRLWPASSGAMGVGFGSSALLINCQFVGNEVVRSGDSGDGGGGGGEGGAFVAGSDSTPNLVNCSFVANFAPGAGAICSFDNANPTISNCVLWRNSARRGSQIGLIEMNGSRPTFATVRSSVVEGGVAEVYVASNSCLAWEAGNFDADPRLVRTPDPGPDETWGTPDDDFGAIGLCAGSPAVDAGDNASVPPDVLDLDGDGDTSEPIPLDSAGCARFVDDPLTPDRGAGSPPRVDLGAFEFQPRGAAEPTPPARPHR